MIINIHNNAGECLASAPTMSEAVQKLVELCDRNRATITRYQSLFYEIQNTPPDVSATAPEHIAVYSAGWKACRERCHERWMEE